MVFNHSVKVPTQYKKAAIIFKKVLQENKSLKDLIYQERHAKTSNLLALFGKYSNNREIIEKIIEESKILVENPRLDPQMCRVLVTELMFGAGHLNGLSRPVTCVLSYHDKFKEHIQTENYVPSTSKKVEKRRYVRINSHLITDEEVDQLLVDEGWKKNETTFNTYDEFLECVTKLAEDEYLFDMHVPRLLIFSSKWKKYWACHEYTKEKKFLLQDKATCLAAVLLDPKPTSIVLDMCAAPGMKSIHLSNLMSNQGTIYAIEQNENRYNSLCNMVNSSQATSVKPMYSDVLNISNEDTPGVEYILVDPSCSGSGMQSRISILNDTKDADRLSNLALVQSRILLHAMRTFPTVKRIVYSTCSIYPEENEEVIQKCMNKCNEFKLLNAKKLLNRKWKNVGDIKYTGIGKNCIYALPNIDLTDGIFIAVFERLNLDEM